MKKFIYMAKEMLYLIKRNKLYFLAPILLTLAILALLVFSIGPTVVITFIYAGI